LNEKVRISSIVALAFILLASLEIIYTLPGTYPLELSILSIEEFVGS